MAKNSLQPTIVARYIRVHPKTWYSHISMRMELLGCPFGKFLPSLQSTSRLFFALRGEINLRREKFDRSYNCKLLVQREFGIRRGHKTRAFLNDACQLEVKSFSF